MDKSTINKKKMNFDNKNDENTKWKYLMAIYSEQLSKSPWLALVSRKLDDNSVKLQYISAGVWLELKS